MQLLRRIDTRIPKPLLSSVANPSNNNLGKLADLRSSPIGTSAISRPSSAAAISNTSGVQSAGTASTQSGGRGWTAVVARSNTPTSSPAWNIPARESPVSSAVPAQAIVQQTQVPSRLVPLGSTPGGNIGVRPSVEETSVPDDWENDV